jgi:hypothetical protein
MDRHLTYINVYGRIKNSVDKPNRILKIRVSRLEEQSLRFQVWAPLCSVRFDVQDALVSRRAWMPESGPPCMEYR